MSGPCKTYAPAHKYHAGNAPLLRCNQKDGCCPCLPYGERVRAAQLSNLNPNRSAQPLDSRVQRLTACGSDWPSPAAAARVRRTSAMFSPVVYIIAVDPCVFANALFIAYQFANRRGSDRVQTLLARGYRYSLASSPRSRMVARNGKQTGGCGGQSVVVEAPDTTYVYSYGDMAPSEILSALPGACRALSRDQQKCLQAAIAEFWLGTELAAKELLKINPVIADNVPLDTICEKAQLLIDEPCTILQPDNISFGCQ